MNSIRRFAFAAIFIAFIPCLGAFAQEAVPAPGASCADVGARGARRRPRRPPSRSSSITTACWSTRRSDGGRHVAQGAPLGRHGEARASSRVGGSPAIRVLIFLCSTPSSQVAAPGAVRIGGMPLHFPGVQTRGQFEPAVAVQGDAQRRRPLLPRSSSAIRSSSITGAAPHDREAGHAPPRRARGRGRQSRDGHRAGRRQDRRDSLSFALDNGASYSFVPDDVVEAARQAPSRLAASRVRWAARTLGMVASQEEQRPILRVPEIVWGAVRLLVSASSASRPSRRMARRSARGIPEERPARWTVSSVRTRSRPIASRSTTRRARSTSRRARGAIHTTWISSASRSAPKTTVATR